MVRSVGRHLIIGGIALALLLCHGSSGLAQMTPQQWCQREARLQAQADRGYRHFNSPPAGYKAGVGYSSSSAAAAVRQCCYWYGTRRPGVRRNLSQPRTFHVSQGASGRWYAAALFRR